MTNLAECLECGYEFDEDNAPECGAYDDGEKCISVRMCESCEQSEVDSESGLDYLCSDCLYEAEQERRDLEWDYRNA